MKLNVKNTVLVGFAFLGISAFWQMYDSLIPKILTGTFNISKIYSGIIMASDNIIALFILPLFGYISDRCKSSFGRRKPFILVGTVASATLMIGLPLIDNSYFSSPEKFKITLFIINLALLLIAMGIYRSPAVALMPDITPKVLRSKANAIINLMGAVGGVIYLVTTAVLYSNKRTEGLEHISYLPIFTLISGIMLLCLLVILIFVNEPVLVKSKQNTEKDYFQKASDIKFNDIVRSENTNAEIKSLVFLLFSVFFWFIGYNGVTTWFTVYAEEMWGMRVGQASACITVATVGSIISYIPIGGVSYKIGRRKTVKFGILLLSLVFMGAYICTLAFDRFNFILLILFLLVGVAWAAINVNSLPMVVEMCAENKIGKFTGLYYSFSMSAQIITPVFAGFILEKISHRALFPYAAIASVIALLTMSFVKHGDTMQYVKKGFEAFETDG